MEEGFNELPGRRRQNLWSIAFKVIREPMFLFLIAGGTIYLVLGDIREALMLLGFVFVIIGITFYQERKTERVLDALRDLASPRALVIRDGVKKRIPGREVVRGDILLLTRGDRVPADAVILWCSHLLVDESLLTGESVPVRKSFDRSSLEGLPLLYSGTLVVQGQAIAEVKETGGRTEIGRIGRRLQTLEREDSPLQKETRKTVRNLAIVGLSLCALVVIVYGIRKGIWLDGFLAGITMAMAILPEEFPVVLITFLALGAWRISKNRVLTRRTAALEALGSATVLCVDKTGTLTLNRMSVKKIFANGHFYEVKEPEPLPEAFHEIVEFAILASRQNPFDPEELALKELGEINLSSTEHLHHNWTLVQEYPLSKRELVMSSVWKSPKSEDYIIAAKGAPEGIFDLCHLDKAEIAVLSEQVAALAEEGLRIIGVAKASFQKTPLPGEQHDFKFHFLGFIGFTDPVRPGVSEAIKECYKAGIKVVMITGDYVGTAKNVARQIGLEPTEVITGPELDRISDSLLRERIKRTNIFARVMPEQKLRLVNALVANQEVCAMTGDGVNDAPALKAAHIGIAMGGRGTDVAREAADLVLLDDDFSSIVQAIRLGRRIFDNLKKAIAYIIAVHVPIAGMSLLPVLFNWPLVLLPVHILFLELLIDPACSIVFEAEPAEANVMNQPPRRFREPLFDKRTISLSLLQGLSVLIIVLAVFGIALNRGQGADEARALSFTTLIVANLGSLLTNRSWSRTIITTFHSSNTPLWWVLGGAILLLGMVLYIPFLRSLFHFGFLHFVDIIICLTAGLISIMWFEGLKILKLSHFSAPTGE